MGTGLLRPIHDRQLREAAEGLAVCAMHKVFCSINRSTGLVVAATMHAVAVRIAALRVFSLKEWRTDQDTFHRFFVPLTFALEPGFSRAITIPGCHGLYTFMARNEAPHVAHALVQTTANTSTILPPFPPPRRMGHAAPQTSAANILSQNGLPMILDMLRVRDFDVQYACTRALFHLIRHSGEVGWDACFACCPLSFFRAHRPCCRVSCGQTGQANFLRN